MPEHVPTCVGLKRVALSKLGSLLFFSPPYTTNCCYCLSPFNEFLDQHLRRVRRQYQIEIRVLSLSAFCHSTQKGALSPPSLSRGMEAPQNSHDRLPHSSPTPVFRKECLRTSSPVSSPPHDTSLSRRVFGPDVLAAWGTVVRGEPAELACRTAPVGSVFRNLTLSYHLVVKYCAS